ncbi:MAG: hypothetical protein ACTSYR_01545 [Candidatus Odinarchaeia archaeon]
MDIRDFNFWLNFKENCRNRVNESCKLKNGGLCIYVLCPLIKLDRDFDFFSLAISVNSKKEVNKK